MALKTDGLNCCITIVLSKINMTFAYVILNLVTFSFSTRVRLVTSDQPTNQLVAKRLRDASCLSVSFNSTKRRVVFYC